MAEDFIYTVNQVAIILNKSDKTVRTYIAEGLLDSIKKIEERSGIEKVFISASSLANLTEKRALRVNFDALEKYTPNTNVLESLFGRRGFSGEEGGASSSSRERPDLPTSSPVTPIDLPTSSNTSDESLVVAILKEQVSKLEAEKDELKQDLKEKDRQLEEKNLSLIAATRENSDKYQLIALAKEQAEARLAKLTEHIRILHLSTNRDIRRLQEGKLQAGDLSFLPLSSENQTGDQESDVSLEEDQSSSPSAEEEFPVSVPEAAPPVESVQPDAKANEEGESRDSEIAPPPPPRKARSPKAPRPKPKRQKKPEEKPAPKRGFLRRLFGG